MATRGLRIGYPSSDDGGTDVSQIWHFQNFSEVSDGTVAGTLTPIGSAPGEVQADPNGGDFKVVHDEIAALSHNTFGFGSITNFPANLVEGDEVWVSAKAMIGVGGNHNAGPNLKWHRVRVQNASSVHIGYNDLYLNDDGHWLFNWEGDHGQGPDGDGWWHFNDNDAFEPQPGVWTTIEMHVVLGAEPEDDGGNGRVDLWVDGIHVGSTTALRTLNNSTDQAWTFYQWTYWNDGDGDAEGVYPTEDMDWYWTDHAIALKCASLGRDDSVHLTTDSDGRKMIGVVA